MRDALGIVFGETSTHSFKVALADAKSVRRREYVKVWHDVDGWVLCQIAAITRSDARFSEQAVFEHQTPPEKGEERVVAHVEVVGSRGQDGVLRVPSIPFSPGEKVFKADSDLIRSTLGLERGELYIGKLEGHDIDVRLDANAFVQRHCSILAMTGSGKSYTAGVIIEELMEQGVPLLIIDPHGEYSSLKYPSKEHPDQLGIAPKGYGDRVRVFTPADPSLNPEADSVLRLKSDNLTVQDIIRVLGDSPTNTHTGILYEAISRLRAERDRYDLNDIIAEVAASESKAKWGVLAMLEQLSESELFEGEPTPLSSLMKRGRASIISMVGVSPNLQPFVVSLVCTELFEARKRNAVPPGMLVVEEAHNFAPERGFQVAPSTEVLRTIASEGRKFGLGLMIISQRPARVDKNVLSQCNTQIILRVTGRVDIQALAKGVEGMTSELVEDIKSLPMGTAVISSASFEQPIIVRVRPRRTEHGGASASILDHKGDVKGTKHDTKRKEKPQKVEEKRHVVVAEPEKKGGMLSKLFGTKR
ncbi:MAG: helicase HerA domain-containing protein [Methermicoccaceae archaeon]